MYLGIDPQRRVGAFNCCWRTDLPLVDAVMRELREMDYVSDRVRLNAASVLVHDLNLNWRWGAVHLECYLLDSDPVSNYGNCAYIAKVGNDSRDGGFDVLSQAERYDPGAEYITRWCPELDGLIAESFANPDGWTTASNGIGVWCSARTIQSRVVFPKMLNRCQTTSV